MQHQEVGEEIHMHTNLLLAETAHCGGLPMEYEARKAEPIKGKKISMILRKFFNKK
jgi:hypothetical protein